MFNSNVYYEVWAREHDKKSLKQPLDLIATFKREGWQFAMKMAKKLKKKHREIIVREYTVTHSIKIVSDKKQKFRGKTNGDK